MMVSHPLEEWLIFSLTLPSAPKVDCSEHSSIIKLTGRRVKNTSYLQILSSRILAIILTPTKFLFWLFTLQSEIVYVLYAHIIALGLLELSNLISFPAQAT